MKKTLFLLILFFIPLSGFGQIVFEKGYFINNDNIRTECLIKNMDWQYNPAEFQFKMGPNGVAQKATIKNVREFRVYGYPKYVRDSVQIDRSSNNFDTFDWNRDPVWSGEVLFLRVVTEGKASLYAYESTNYKRFFYSVGGSAIIQLVYKIYKADSYSRKENNLYRQQIWVDLPLSENSKKLAEKMIYDEKNLSYYFNLYNKLNSDPYKEDPEKAIVMENSMPKRDRFNLKISSAITYTRFSIENMFTGNSVPFAQFPGYSLGAELEFILPFNKNKWGIFADPALSHFKDTQEDYLYTFKTNQFCLDMPVGIRYYLFLNNRKKFFINAFYLFNLSGGEFKFRVNGMSDFTSQASNKIGTGVGYSYKNFSIETRYIIPHLMLPVSDYQQFSIILRYRLWHNYF